MAPPLSRKHPLVRPRASSPLFVTHPSNSPFYAAESTAVGVGTSYMRCCHSQMRLSLELGFQAFLFSARCHLSPILLQGYAWQVSIASHQSWRTKMRTLPFQGQRLELGFQLRRTHHPLQGISRPVGPPIPLTRFRFGLGYQHEGSSRILQVRLKLKALFKLSCLLLPL